MNAVIYYVNSHKKINGTLFYCFEYYSFIKQYIPDLKIILLNTSDEDMKFIKEIFIEKYLIDNVNCLNLTKITDFAKLNIQNLLILDINTYKKIKDFSYKIDKIHIYSNDTNNYLNKKNNHIFYGWYDFQNFNIKTRIKLFKELHRTFKDKGNKTFITFLNADNKYVLYNLGINDEDVYVKKLNEHNKNLFQNINRIIYWHNGQLDKNNRTLIESQIHNIELLVYLNGYEHDSIKERWDTIQQGNVDEYYLTIDDILVQNFIKDCNVRN